MMNTAQQTKTPGKVNLEPTAMPIGGVPSEGLQTIQIQNIKKLRAIKIKPAYWTINLTRLSLMTVFWILDGCTGNQNRILCCLL